MQIRTQLTEAGLDVAGTEDLRETVASLKAAIDAQAAKNKAMKERAPKVDKSGTLALTFLDSLISILSMVYRMVEQGDGPSPASDFRLVVSTWREQPSQRRRCTPSWCLQMLCSCVCMYTPDHLVLAILWSWRSTYNNIVHV